MDAKDFFDKLHRSVKLAHDAHRFMQDAKAQTNSTSLGKIVAAAEKQARRLAANLAELNMELNGSPEELAQPEL